MEERIEKLEEQMKMVLKLLRTYNHLNYEGELRSEILEDYGTKLEELRDDFNHLNWQINKYDS